MNLIHAIEEMSTLTQPTEESVRNILMEDYHVIVADKNFGMLLLKYDLFIQDGVLFVAKMSDSEQDEIFLTPESAALFTKEYFHSIWSSYLSGKDAFIVDTIGHMHNSSVRLGQYDIDIVKQHLQDNEVLYFNDLLLPIEGQPFRKISIYIIDHNELQLIGIDQLTGTIGNIAGAEITSDKGAADIIIVILPNATRAPHNRFFQWLSDEVAKIPVVKETLNATDDLSTKDHGKTLLFWTSNVFMTSLVSPKEAEYRATLELDDAIKSIQK